MTLENAQLEFWYTQLVAVYDQRCILHSRRIQAQCVGGAHVAESSGVEIQGRHLNLSNLQKVLYPAVGFTKKDVIDYYARIAPVMLPQLHDRALTRKRYP